MHSAEFMGLVAVYFSFLVLVSLSAMTTESRDVGDKLSSILRSDGAWESNVPLTEEFFKVVETGLSTDLIGYVNCASKQTIVSFIITRDSYLQHRSVKEPS